MSDGTPGRQESGREMAPVHAWHWPSAGGSSRRFSVATWTVCDDEVRGLWVAVGRTGSSYDVDLDLYPWHASLDYGSSELGAATLVELDNYQAACGSEPDAGTFSVQSGRHELLYTCDGASSCDGLVPVTLDGVAQEAVPFP